MCHYRTSCLCRVPVTLGKAPDGKRVFADCHFSGTRQRGCREPRQICHVGAAGDGAFAKCLTAGTRQRPKLCRVPGFCTWESLKLCRMPAGWHSAKLLFLVYPLWPLLPSVFPYALGKVTKIFLFHFSLFFNTNTTKIYLNTGTLQAVIITNI